MAQLAGREIEAVEINAFALAGRIGADIEQQFANWLIHDSPICQPPCRREQRDKEPSGRTHELTAAAMSRLRHSWSLLIDRASLQGQVNNSIRQVFRIAYLGDQLKVF